MGELIEGKFSGAEEKNECAKDDLTGNISNESDQVNLKVNKIVTKGEILKKYRNILANVSLGEIKTHLRNQVNHRELPDLLLESIKKGNITVEIDDNKQPILIIKLHLRIIQCCFMKQYIESKENTLLNQYKLIAFVAFIGSVTKKDIDELTLEDCINNEEKEYIEFHFNSEKNMERRILHAEIKHPDFWKKKKKLIKTYSLLG